MAGKPIQVLIVDESLFFRQFMARSLSTDPAINVVGGVSNTQDALKRIPILKPNLLCLNIDISAHQQKEYINQLQQVHPNLQVIIISSPSNGISEALKAGAVDFVSKPSTRMQMDSADFLREVAAKIKAVHSTSLSGLAQRPGVPERASSPVTAAIPARTAPSITIPILPVGDNWRINNPGGKRLIAIGASTGGTEAILAVVKDLPVNTPGIVIVQHMPPVFTRMYAERLNKMCKMSVKEAENGDRVQPGHILVAQGDKQMRLGCDAQGYYVKVRGTDKISGHCPSVDCLFESVSTISKSNAVGVILTGMGGDGAMGLLKMRKAGAYTIGQDETTCVVYGMPMVAYNMGAVQDQLPLGAIPSAILRYLCK